MRLEFYRSGGSALLAAVDSESCPNVGEKVNIRKANWLVVARSWAVDDLSYTPESVRVCLYCEETDDSLP